MLRKFSLRMDAYNGGGFNESEDKLKRVRDPIQSFIKWIEARSAQEKVGLGVALGVLTMFILWLTLVDHDVIFIIAEATHFVGIGVLVYKLTQKKTCAGLSLQSQILTAVFLLVRFLCSVTMEWDLHTLLDFLTLAGTGWVIYMVWFKLQHTWQKEQDVIQAWYVAVPCLVLAFLSHPNTSHNFLLRVFWAFCVYLEAVSVLPQLRMMQNNKVVERFTAHYVFALGISRFFTCAHWVIQLIDGTSFLFTSLGVGVWPIMVVISEIVQTFILADFCYYYVKSQVQGQGIVRLPAGIV
eukprot:TRINITY_DN8853_c0_g1_i4.p1 TRINITY_DN8853_c0_g1~~TRINITY_DN8853_c0_g1_i4.p1  ORF type:complete len:296 (-),score=23.48 TRINITY_DN8853_c0_g1_i4:185-1072(-)